jgi:hypothetical protein
MDFGITKPGDGGCILRCVQLVKAASSFLDFVRRYRDDCEAIGGANLSRVDGHEVASLHGEFPNMVDSLPDGFKVVGDPRDIDVICTECNVSAWP